MEKFSVFKAKANEVMEFNAAGHSWKKGINAWSDLTDEEFNQRYPVMRAQECSATNKQSVTLKSEDLPAHVDWREEGVISAVKDQSSCGSCWAFSTAGTFEAHYNIQNSLKADSELFAEQQLVDCAGDFDNNGCAGGLPSHAFQYLYYNGFERGSDYTYTAKDEDCKYKEPLAQGATFGSFNITEGDEWSMAQVIADLGPVAVAYQVYGDFRDYRSGVFSSDECRNGPMDVNHAVTAVGYGTDETTGMDYWIVKNSWGARWGDEGYFKIERGVNMCGIGVCNSFPVGVHTYSH